mmetsp:Transcript_41606/g.57910  ORF Transcript_41606/g.57910 Transcript_41606/m.57910 type:complete len:201 (-) Transcript_41606:102-704(-)
MANTVLKLEARGGIGTRVGHLRRVGHSDVRVVVRRDTRRRPPLAANLGITVALRRDGSAAMGNALRGTTQVRLHAVSSTSSPVGAQQVGHPRDVKARATLDSLASNAQGNILATLGKLEALGHRVEAQHGSGAQRSLSGRNGARVRAGSLSRRSARTREDVRVLKARDAVAIKVACAVSGPVVLRTTVHTGIITEASRCS